MYNKIETIQVERLEIPESIEEVSNALVKYFRCSRVEAGNKKR